MPELITHRDYRSVVSEAEPQKPDDDQGRPVIPRLFLADDNLKAMACLLGLGFADAGRLVKITQAFDGAQAYDLLLSASLEGPFPFDLIVLDLNMPKLDGLELLGRLHRWLGLTGVPIVILTSSSNPMDRQRSLIHNPSAYLTKSEDYKGTGCGDRQAGTLPVH
jgi:CheY-like chemotaxis protein